VKDVKAFLHHSMLSSAGNEYLHLMTSYQRYRLRIELTDWKGNKRYAEYDHFEVGSEQEKYRLKSLGKYSGNAGQHGLETKTPFTLRMAPYVAARHRTATYGDTVIEYVDF